MNMNIMRSHAYSALTALLLVLVIVLICSAGCTTAPTATPATGTPAPAPAGAPAGTSAGVISTVPAAKTANIDTTIGVHFNDYTCLDVQKEMGVSYLYPGEKYTLSATTPGTVNVNILFLDTNDNLALREVEPKWDSVNKIWKYEGIVPLVQFNDITGPVQKTFTIKTQSQYYLCVDDRKETGTNDVIYQVPVKAAETLENLLIFSMPDAHTEGGVPTAQFLLQVFSCCTGTMHGSCE